MLVDIYVNKVIFDIFVYLLYSIMTSNSSPSKNSCIYFMNFKIKSHQYIEIPLLLSLLYDSTSYLNSIL